MFEQLKQGIEEVDIPADGEALVEGYRLLDRFAAKLSAALAVYDASGRWGVGGATSMTAWLRHRVGMTSSTAHVTARTARRLHALPVTRDAWLHGSLSGGQVDVIAANIDDRTAPLFAEQERELVPTFTRLTTTQTVRCMQFWRARAEALVGVEPGDGPKRSLHLSRTFGGRWRLDGELDPEGGGIVATALRLATSTGNVGGEPHRTPAQQQGDALVDLCRLALDRLGIQQGGRHRPHLNVVVDYDSLMAGRPGHLVEGGVVDGASIQRLLCDAAVHRVVTDGRSSILDYGTATRTVPANLWAALVLRDGHCRFPGCDRRPEWCEAHHVVPVAEGGPTRLDNLVLKCSRHHHLTHLPGWREHVEPDGALVMTDPSGRTRTTRPAGVAFAPPLELTAA